MQLGSRNTPYSYTRTGSPMPLSCFESIFRASHLGQRLKPQKQAGHMNASNRPHSPNTTIAHSRNGNIEKAASEVSAVKSWREQETR